MSAVDASVQTSAPYTRVEVFLIVLCLVALGFSLYQLGRMPIGRTIATCIPPEPGEVLSVQLVTDGKGGLEARCVTGRGRTK
jgi:hypothetical protein